MDELKERMAVDLRLMANGLEADYIKAVFCVAIGEDGPSQLVLVDPEHRKALITAINEEATRMLGSWHHLVSAEKLQRFCERHKISAVDMLKFQAEEIARDAAEGES